MHSRSFFAIVSIAAALSAHAANVTSTDRVSRELPLAAFGSFWIDNALGSIEVIGADGDRAVVTAVKTVYAADRSILDDAREQCVVSMEGDDRVRLVRTIVRPVANSRCTVSYSVQLPRGADLKIAAKAGDVRVRNLNGNVTVKSFTGSVLLSGVYGSAAVDLTNGRVVFDYPRPPMSNMQATIINGDIDIYVPGDANFEWAASTLAGDLMTTMPVRGSLSGEMFRGHFNAPGGPTMTTQSVLGRIRMLARGSKLAQARSVRVPGGERVSPSGPKFDVGPTAKFQTPIVPNAFIFDFADRIVDVVIGEVRGSAHVETAAGSVDLGTVNGDCNVLTLGGPLNLGEILGSVNARTGAGDILVRAARSGGDIRTGGGIIRLLYTGGPTTLQSGGGDIVVRQAAGSINAQTPSGDINITVDPSAKTERIEARSGKGNISLNLPPRFAADIDAIIMTSDADANGIQSDFASLSIKREQVGNRTRIRAIGKVNGGGERIDLYAEEGDISITSNSTAPVTVITPRSQ